MSQEDKPVAEVLSTQVEAWQREVSALQEKIAFAIGQPVAAQEPVVTNEMAIAFCRALSDSSVSQSELEEVKRGLRNALHDYAAPQPPAIDRDALSEWLRQNMPSGTVIGDPEWWIPRILRALKSKDPDHT